AQQGTTAGEHHAALGDVGTQFRRRVLQCHLHGSDDVVHWVGQGFEGFVAGNGEAARHTFGEVAALDFHFLDFGTGEGRADFLLDGFGGGFADQHAVVAADVGNDGFVEPVATHAHAAFVDHAAQRDHAHFGGAAADVDHHGTGSIRHRQA